MKKFSNIIFALFLIISTQTISSQVDNRAGLTWQVLKYDITATLPKNDSDRNLTAKAILNLRNTTSRSVSKLTLRISEKAEISSVKANGTITDFSKGLPEKIDGNRNLQKLSVNLPTVAANGTVLVEVGYKLTVSDNNGLNTLSPVGSHFLPLSFWYPTPTSWFYAEGADFAPFRVQINESEQVISSGISSGNIFEQKLNGQPFFLAGKWDSAKIDSIEVLMPKGADVEAQKRANELAVLASEAKAFTANLLGNAPEIPLRIVSSRKAAGFSGGGTILVDDGVFRRNKLDSATVLSVSEGVAKIWLGNDIQVYGNGYGVIREGLVRYIANQFIETKYGKDTADIERLRQRIAYSAVSQRDAPLTVVSPVDDFYYTEVANKGAMIWRILAKRSGQTEFFATIKQLSQDKFLDLTEIRDAFPNEQGFLDYAFSQVTDTNFLVGLPQIQGNEAKVALRNTGSADAFVDVVALTANGDKMTTNIALRAKSFGEVTFKNTSKIIRVEVDPDKLYPQTDYSEDVAPRELDENDPYLAVKKAFDKQDFVNAEKLSRIVLRDYPRFDDVRSLLARSLLAQNKLNEAEKEFNSILVEKLPTSRSLTWANVGLGEIAARSNKNSEALSYFRQAIISDADYSASLAARIDRNKLNIAPEIDDSIKDFFAEFDKSAIANNKAQMSALVIPGEINRFVSGLVGQTEKWNTKIIQVDKLNADEVLVETVLNIKLLSRNDESGTTVYRLKKTQSGWKLNGVEIFEVK